MRKYSCGALIIILTLSSCTSTGNQSTVVEEKIRNGIKIGCGFSPTIKTIQELVSLFGGPSLPIVNKVVDAVCSTVKESTASGFRAPTTRDQQFGTYRGVPVVGRSI